MPTKKFIFATNPHKAAAKVTINSIMIGSLFFILTLMWTLDPRRWSPLILGQIVLAIPLLFVSTLAYAKIGYSERFRIWDTFGWLTNNIGTIFVLNAVGLIVGTLYPGMALAYFALNLILMGMYSAANVIDEPDTLGEKIFKFIFFAAILLAGGVLPLFSGY